MDDREGSAVGSAKHISWKKKEQEMPHASHQGESHLSTGLDEATGSELFSAKEKLASKSKSLEEINKDLTAARVALAIERKAHRLQEQRSGHQLHAQAHTQSHQPHSQSHQPHSRLHLKQRSNKVSPIKGPPSDEITLTSGQRAERHRKIRELFRARPGVQKIAEKVAKEKIIAETAAARVVLAIERKSRRLQTQSTGLSGVRQDMTKSANRVIPKIVVTPADKPATKAKSTEQSDVQPSTSSAPDEGKPTKQSQAKAARRFRFFISVRRFFLSHMAHHHHHQHTTVPSSAQ